MLFVFLYLPTNTLYTEIAARATFTHISLVVGVDVPEEGVYAILDSPIPEYDPETQWREEGFPEIGEDGRYYRTWFVYDIPTEGTGVVFNRPINR